MTYPAEPAVPRTGAPFPVYDSGLGHGKRDGSGRKVTLASVRGMHRYSDEQVAEACHGAFAALQAATGDDFPSPPWLHLDPDLRAAAVEGVCRVRRAGASLSPREHYRQWAAYLTERGWVRGPRDPELRAHPALADWEDLPPAEQAKSRLFIAIVIALTLED